MTTPPPTNQPPPQGIHYGVTTPPPKPQSTTAYGWQWAITILIVLGGAVVFFALFWPKDSGSSSDSSPGRADVKLTSCAETSYGSPSAGVSVTNSTSHQASYWITVVFESGGTQLGSATAIINNVEPGQTAVDEAIGFGDSTPAGSTCRISEVTRT